MIQILEKDADFGGRLDVQRSDPDLVGHICVDEVTDQ